MCPFPKSSSVLRKKRRPAHVSPDPQRPVISTPTNFVKVDGMGTPNGTRPTTANPPMSEVANGAPLHRPSTPGYASVEPIVHDFQAIYSPNGSDVPPPRTPTVRPPSLNPLASHPVHSSSDDDVAAPPPPDFTHRGIHIPTRTSSKAVTNRRYLRSSSQRTHSLNSTPESRRQSSASSILTGESCGSPVADRLLSPSPNRGNPEAIKRLSPLLEDDPQSFDLVAPDEDESRNIYSLEQRSEQLFSREHLEAIFRDTQTLLRFTSFLSAFRPGSLPVLIYYLDALKALRAINYANAVAEALEPLEGHDFTLAPARTTVNAILEDKARQSFDVLVRDDLPAFITHVFIQVVSVNIRRRITGHLPPLQREASEGLAEVYCLTDPSRPDNPIIFASEEFHRTTQYGVNYAIGRNCRFLQGPRTNQHSIARLQEAVRGGKEISEVILNYRRDGSPFMNLLMVAPLLDARGKLRYNIGAQVDVSGLVADCTDLDAFRRLVDAQEGKGPPEDEKDEFRELSEMFNHTELDTVRRYGGSMHRELLDEPDDASMHHRSRILLRDPGNGNGDISPVRLGKKPEGALSGVYQHYLLIRPHPSLRILFTSRSLRVPGILQSRFLDRIGGSTRVRDSLAEALADGTRGVTAKIRWLSSPSPQSETDRIDEGRQRWIHCTPLLNQAGAVGVWMVILVDDDKEALAVRKLRHAPPVPKEIRRASYSAPSPHLENIQDSDEDGEREHRSYWRRPAKHPAIQAIRRPGSAMSDLRSQSRSPSYNPSVNSFAL